MPAERSPLPIVSLSRRYALRVFGLGAATLAAACSGLGNLGSSVSSSTPPPPPAEGAEATASLPAPGTSVLGSGPTKVALILPLSAQGNAGAAAQSMRNAAEMGLADFQNSSVQILVKDDGGTAQGAQAAVRQAIEEGASVILGPLFAHAVTAVAPIARQARIPVVAFSTDSNVASRGVFLLSFLPESDVDRVISYAVAEGKHGFAALIPDNAYGSAVEAAFRQIVPAKGGRVVAVERYKPDDKGMREPVQQIAQAASRADALFIPDSGETALRVAKLLAQAGVAPGRLQVLGTGLWDEPRIYSDGALAGGWYAGPDREGFKNFVTRYRAKYGQDPVRTATLAYDAVALMVALSRAQPGQPITADTLLSPSGFAGIDGVFRFRADGTNQRGLAIHKVTPAGGEVISGAPKSFG